jgi:2-amino-4-hydroxy-6-hydroxymethyldihydropteridine diphosphokinase
MPKHVVYIGTGTNLGDRLVNLRAAVELLPPLVTVKRTSGIYETAPWGVVDQPNFLNQVLEVETDLDPQPLLAFLKRLEQEIGRKPSYRYGPRLIDMDILFFDHLVLTADDLVIPHPQMADRAFVLIPLAELSPNLLHPVLKLTVTEMLDAVKGQQVNLYQP